MWMQDDTFYNALQWFKANQPVDSAANYVLHDHSGKSLDFNHLEGLSWYIFALQG